VQQFFRYYARDPSLTVPALSVSAGPAAALLTRMLGISAITFGARILVAPALVSRTESGALCLPAPLVVHEAAHVLQYRSQGAFRFLAGYVREYLAGLHRARSFDSVARQTAYLEIPAERAARDAVEGYRGWCGARGAPGVRLNVLVRG
jgi:hypothetical protein